MRLDQKSSASEPFAVLRSDNNRAGAEQFDTGHEAVNRASPDLAQDFSRIVVIRGDAGNELSGVRLRFRLGLCIE